MKALIQRVSRAAVEVSGQCVGQIGSGLLIFLGVDKGDEANQADRLLEKVLNYRVFPDAQGKMNCSAIDLKKDVLVVSQFTLSADTAKGLRPSFSSAAPPDEAEALYGYFLDQLRSCHGGAAVASGSFGADMQVSLVNDGPVTFLLES